MTQLCTIVGGRTSFPNSPESDRQPTVMCDVDVRLADGTEETVRLHAEAPDTAMEAVRSMPDAQFKALPRVKSK